MARGSLNCSYVRYVTPTAPTGVTQMFGKVMGGTRWGYAAAPTQVGQAGGPATMVPQFVTPHCTVPFQLTGTEVDAILTCGLRSWYDGSICTPIPTVAVAIGDANQNIQHLFESGQCNSLEVTGDASGAVTATMEFQFAAYSVGAAVAQTGAPTAPFTWVQATALTMAGAAKKVTRWRIRVQNNLFARSSGDVKTATTVRAPESILPGSQSIEVGYDCEEELPAATTGALSDQGDGTLAFVAEFDNGTETLALSVVRLMVSSQEGTHGDPHSYANTFVAADDDDVFSWVVGAS